jgi:hypothetical protein
MAGSVPPARRGHHWEWSLGDDPDPRHHRLMVRRLCILVIALAIVGCGSSSGGHSSTTTTAASEGTPSARDKLPAPIQVCPDTSGAWR